MKGEAIEGIQPNNVTFNSLIDCCVRCDNMHKAMEIFNEMQMYCQVRSIKEDSLGEGKKGGWQGKRKEVYPDLITYSTMIKGFCRQKNIEQALVMMNQMEKEGIIADEVLYNSLLDGCCKANELELALKAYKNMKILHIQPSNVTFSILVKIYGKMRDLNKALSVLDDMK